MNLVLALGMEESLKLFWRFIKALRNDSSGIAVLRVNDRITSDGAEKAKILNKYLKTVFTKEDLKYA